jgi:hypothetical protein
MIQIVQKGGICELSKEYDSKWQNRKYFCSMYIIILCLGNKKDEFDQFC